MPRVRSGVDGTSEKAKTGVWRGRWSYLIGQGVAQGQLEAKNKHWKISSSVILLAQPFVLLLLLRPGLHPLPRNNFEPLQPL
jgi:hypothetical protein